MSEFQRYAVYFAPRPGDFATRAAAWLGRDAETGLDVTPPDLPGLPAPLADLTRAPRRYGFHATLKAPFRLATGVAESDLIAACAALAATLAPVAVPELVLARLGGFLALVPGDEVPDLQELAAQVVRALDPCRAALTEAEIARRHPDRLTPRQRDHLQRWGYPHVFDDFRFHLTLSDDLAPDLAQALATVAEAHFAPVLPRPLRIEDMCLFGEAPDGRFRLIHRQALSG